MPRTKMDAIEIKRAKEREKKRKQREKLKQDKEKHAQSLAKDADRKRTEREKFKQAVEEHPRKYQAKVEKLRQQNAARVKRFREKQRAEKTDIESPKEVHPQKLRRMKEQRSAAMAEQRNKDKHQREQTRRRVQNYRLRIQLANFKSGASPKGSHNSDTNFQSPLPTTEGYKHRSSESRAFKRVNETLPQTPAKKVRIIEKIVRNTTPRSRKVLSESPSIQAVFLGSKSRRKLNVQSSFIETVKQKMMQRSKNQMQPVRLVADKLLKKSRAISLAARELGIERKTLSRCINSEEKPRKVRIDKLTEEHATLVQNFYLEEASRPMPNKRDVLLLTDDSGKKVPVQKHLMELSQEDAFKKFKQSNPNVKLGQRKFDLLKPSHVRRTKLRNRIVCCCTYCENVRLKVQTLNRFTKNSTSSASVVESTLCDKTGRYHNANCLKRKCENCGTEKLKQEYTDCLRTQGDAKVTWREWKKEVVPPDEQRNVSRVILKECSDTFKQFLDNLCSDLQPHAEHTFRASWQYDQFRDNVNNVAPGDLVMVMDFSENYTCRHGREVQPYHWNQKQITLHPIMLYYQKDGSLQKEGYTVITDDLKHDASAVATFEKAAVEHVRAKGVEIQTVHQWTDGCASQYKCHTSFAEISVAETSHNVHMTRNYFETSHGKGPCDGLGGIIKRKVSNAVLHNNDLSVSSAAEMHQFCESRLTDVGESSYTSRKNKYEASSRTFKLVEKVDRTRITRAKTLPGSRKLHSVSSTGVGFQIKVRELNCYCYGCRNAEQCLNSDYVDQWCVKVLRPHEQTEAETEQTETEEHLQEQQQTEDQRPENSEATPTENASEDMSTLSVNSFVAIKLETKRTHVCYFAKVKAVDNDCICVEYLEKTGSKYYKYKSDSQDFEQNISDIVCILPEPEIVVSGSRVYCVFKLNEEKKTLLKRYKCN